MAKMAPIDPNQLLRALDPLLSSKGGICEQSQVNKLSSLMKKFSKKLVSRMTYCMILEGTSPELLGEFLNASGWETLNLWIQEAITVNLNETTQSLLNIFQALPMTVDRLKQNNTAKLIKSLTKHPDESIKSSAQEIVDKWMALIKQEPTSNVAVVKKKKKRDSIEDINTKKITKRIKLDDKVNQKKTSSEEEEDDRKNKENNSSGVEAQESSPPSPKKPLKPDRPKTVKTYHGKFRSTGLEEAAQLPKAVMKKTTTMDKSALIKPFKRNLSNPSSTLLAEKRPKVSLLNSLPDKAQPGGGIKIIPAKPKFILETSGFMESFNSPQKPVRKKKPASPKTTSPPATLIPPKLEFYKDTLEINNKKDDAKPDSTTKSESPEADKDAEMEEEEEEEEKPLAPGELRSILSIIKRKNKKKKSIKWKDDGNLVDISYFEMDETERCNVNKIQNFVDMKQIESKRERQNFEICRRVKGDKMVEQMQWKMPALIDLPPSNMVVASGSTEKRIQEELQKTTLQELYFSRECIPDAPHEPDQHDPIVQSEPPKIIPLEDLTNSALFTDYTAPEYKSPLPPVLSNLFSTSKNLLPGMNMDPMTTPPPTHIPENFVASYPGIELLTNSMSIPPILDERLNAKPALLETPPPSLPMPSIQTGFQDKDVGGTWLPLDSNPNMQEKERPIMPPQMRNNGPMHNNNNKQMRDRGWNGGNNHQQQRNNNHRMRGPPRVQCRHFAMGTCRFGSKCTFLHPGVNGPML